MLERKLTLFEIMQMIALGQILNSNNKNKNEPQKASVLEQFYPIHTGHQIQEKLKID